MRPGEVFETVPGLIVSQHSGEGKANQYYLRGFNLDHGTDFSMTVAGVPVNTPTGAHAHGYADVGFLVPELVSGVQYKKGSVLRGRRHWRPRPWLITDPDVSFSRARFTDDDPAGNRIPGALDRVISAGVTVDSQRSAFASLRLRHFGPRALVEDATVTSASTTLWNGELGYRVSSRARVVAEVFNLFDAKVADIDYFYTSRLPGEPAEGFDDVHTHPALPQSVRVGLHLSF